MWLVVLIICTALLSPACLYAQSETIEDSESGSAVTVSEDTECPPETDDCSTGEALSYEDEVTEGAADRSAPAIVGQRGWARPARPRASRRPRGNSHRLAGRR